MSHAHNSQGRLDVMTMVFTDVVGSVRLKSRLGNLQALALLKEHDEILRGVLREFPEGIEISTAGDSFFIAFHRPSDAVGFALRLQARLRQWNQGKRVMCRSRIGINTGEVAVELDATGGVRDLRGIEVDKCSRVMSLGGPDQILLSGFVSGNARSHLDGLSLPEVGALSWVSHGMYPIKGFDEPVEICEVGESGHAPLVAPRGAARMRFWGGAILCALVGAIFLILPPLSPLSHTSYDLAYLLRRTAPPTNAVLVLTDSKSHEILKQPKGQAWDRELHARLIRHLNTSGARAVVFDVWFDESEGSSPAANAALLEAVRKHTNVLVAGVLQLSTAAGFETVQWKPPFPDLAAAVPWGAVHYDQQQGSITRKPGAAGLTHGKESLPREVVRFLGGELPPLYRDLWLNYYGPPGTIPAFPYWQVLSNQVPAPALAGKIVFVGDVNDEQVGTTGGWRSDEAPTPYTLWLRRNAPGVEIVATTTLNLLHGDWLHRLLPWRETGIVLVVGVVAGAGLARLRPTRALWVGLGSAVLVALACMWIVWQTGVWFPWLVVSGVQIPLALLWSWVAWRAPVVREGIVIHTATQLQEEDPRPGGSALTSSPTRSKVGQALHCPPPAAHQARRALPGTTGSWPQSRSRRDSTLPLIPHYQLHREIGHGAYGQVWLCRDDVKLWRAVKVVQRASFRDPAPYEREFAGIQRFTPVSLEHPGLMRVLHVGRAQDDRYFFYVMELADPEGGLATEGEAQPINPETYAPRTLASDLKTRKHLPAAVVANIGIALAEALQFLHRHQLIHRDIKPANVLFVGGRPRLADIGLVTTMAEQEGGASNLGTYGYLAPEGPGAATADVFGLGRLLYVAATGCQPTQFPEFPDDLDRRRDTDLMLKLSDVWCRACEPNPAERFASAEALAAALRDLTMTKEAPPAAGA